MTARVAARGVSPWVNHTIGQWRNRVGSMPDAELATTYAAIEAEVEALDAAGRYEAARVTAAKARIVRREVEERGRMAP